MHAFSSDILSVSVIRNDPLEFGNIEGSRSVLSNKLEYFYDTNGKYVNPGVTPVFSVKWDINVIKN